MTVTWWPTKKLWQPENAPRRFSKKELSKARVIIQRFGFRVPLVIDASGRVIFSHLLVAVAREIGLEQIPVVLADDLSESEKDALSLALSNFYSFGKFDQQLLGELLIDIESAGTVDLGDIGFDAATIDVAIDLSRKGKGERAEDIPQRVDAAVSVLGDVWLCGSHRVGCGDAGDAVWLKHLLASRHADMTFADPPYGCRVAGFVTSRAHREFIQGSGQEDGSELSSLFRSWCEAIRASCRPGALVYLCIDWRSLDRLLAAAVECFGELLNLIVWAKDQAGMGSFYRSQHELVLLLRVPGAAHMNNVELGRHGRNRSNLWTYPSASSFARSGTEGDLLADHPTPKNKEMIVDAIRDCTRRGDVVLDPFSGSGSTVIAAEKTGRRACASDLDPGYVDVTVRRWQLWSGKDATHADTGLTFNQAARDRSGDGAVA